MCPRSVRDILNLYFKGDIKSQIEYRKYFYKSSKMVREGMVTVHNSGFEADAAQSLVQVRLEQCEPGAPMRTLSDAAPDRKPPLAHALTMLMDEQS
jgi:hypothetical protein